jgi:hypothetical protein
MPCRRGPPARASDTLEKAEPGRPAVRPVGGKGNRFACRPAPVGTATQLRAGVKERTGRLSPRPVAYISGVRDARLFLRRVIRAARLAATDERIPRPLRWLALAALLPVPGPFDEALLLVVAVPLGLFYRAPLADAWRTADAAHSAS